MEPAVGLRVVRGPDWEWGDQDGGEGFVGTVAGLEEGGGGVIVQWDMGQRSSYRCGKDNKFDLRVLDSGPIPRSQETGIDCGWCQEEGLVGCVWRCTRCLDYYLCSQCYHNNRHCTRHPFFIVPSSTDPKTRERVNSRLEAGRVAVRGIFAGARVTRGHDWKWENQDGGMSGLVLTVKGWRSETKGGVVEVQWEGRGQKNVYRAGHRGKMDLKCLIPGEGGWYSPDHLPLLGGRGWEGSEGGEFEFAAGDAVRIDLDLESARLMQEGHGGWTEPMNACTRDVGEVIRVCEDGDVQVRYSSNSVFNFNPVVLLKVDIQFHVPGKAIRVLDDIEKVHELQTAGPGWNDDITLTLGMVGLVTKRMPTGEVQASVNGQRWQYHPKCLLQVPRNIYQSSPDVEDVDKIALVKVFTILRQGGDTRDGVWYLAATGDVPSLQTCLQRFPEEINRKLRGKTAVHVACAESFAGCLKLLLSYHPDLELVDDNGLRPIHVCAYSNFAEGARLLLDHGVDINSKDGRQNTAIMAAGALGHYEVLEVLLGHRLLNLHAGDHIGSTALHCAVIAKRDMAVKLLLEAGADPSIPNYTASTPLHDASAVGYLASVERMVAYFPEHINLLKCDDGHTPLHAAVLLNRVDVTHFLLSQPSCQVDRRTSDKGLTALHMAVNEGYTAVVELLVGYGADVNATVENGSTALHMVLALKKMKPLSPDTPHLKQIDSSLAAGYGHGQRFEPYLFVACMLVQEGADPHVNNRLGETPLQKCRPDLGSIIRLFAQKRGEYRGSLRSKMSVLPTNLKRRNTVPAEAAVDPTSQQTVAGFPKHLKEDTKPVADTTPPAAGTPAAPTQTSQGSVGEGSQSPAAARTERERQGLGTGESGREGGRMVTGEASGGGEGVESHSGSGAAELAPPQQGDAEDRLCCLCDLEIDARLVPCGHSVMCRLHAGIAKRCPTCNEKIKGSTAL